MPISGVLLAAEGYRSVENWLSRLAPATARMNRHDIGYFMKWLSENGASFKDYKWSIRDKEALYNAVRSFFTHNRARAGVKTSK